jgi:hypothetical protein
LKFVDALGPTRAEFGFLGAFANVLGAGLGFEKCIADAGAVSRADAQTKSQAEKADETNQELCMHRNRCRRILVFSEYLSAKIETFPEQAVDFSDLSQTTPTRAGRKK